jgi:hypothetical protein
MMAVMAMTAMTAMTATMKPNDTVFIAPPLIPPQSGKFINARQGEYEASQDRWHPVFTGEFPRETVYKVSLCCKSNLCYTGGVPGIMLGADHAWNTVGGLVAIATSSHRDLRAAGTRDDNDPAMTTITQ